MNSLGKKCVVYREDTITKTNLGGLHDMKKDRKIVWINPNNNSSRCPVRLIEKYLNLLPEGGSKLNLYLHSLKHPKPFVWHTTTPLGINKVRTVVSSMLRDAGLDGFFTDHSLRRTCATRLFQAGTNVKLIKEITGHVSTAVEKYETTSDQQRMHLSNMLQGGVHERKLSEAPPMQVVEDVKNISIEEKFKLPKLVINKCDKSEQELGNSTEISNIIESSISAVGDRKAKLMFQIEIVE